MALAPGTRLGPYEILAPIGAGGMGEVYRARDTRLGRDVAIKVSHENFTERFEQEARSIAALNHPNICHLYDVGPNYLVMELVEGTPLKGPLPIEQAVEYAAQILDALDAAHRKGITHRDLKPANVLVTRQGIKLLDFGLAKQAVRLSEDDATEALTAQGQIVGTLQYMSPEQLQGKVADPRSDLFSFGYVLYELLTGKRAFDGPVASSVIAAILEREPESIEIAQPLDRVIRRSLAKDPDQRFQTARDLKAALAWAMEASPAAPASHASQRSSKLLSGTAAALAIGLAALAFVHFREKPSAPEAPVRFQVQAPENAPPTALLTLSPDGRKLALIAGGRLWVHFLESGETRDLMATEGLPFWSPDSRFLGYQSAGKIRKIEATGGPSQIVADLPGGWDGGAWSRDDVIVFGAEGSGLFRVPASGGVPIQITRVDPGRQEQVHAQPSFLPDARHFVYARASTSPEESAIYLGSVDAKPEQQSLKPLVASTWGAVYAPSADPSTGYLLFMREGTLMAQPFDNRRWELTGRPTAIAEQVADNGGGTGGVGAFSSSSNDVLVFRRGAISGLQLKWLDRAGKMLGTAGEPGDYQGMALSPDGTHVALAKRSGPLASNIWMLDLSRETSTRFTFASEHDTDPVWSPEGDRIAFTSGNDLYQKPASSAKDAEAMLKSSEVKHATNWSRDGRFLLYTVVRPGANADIWVLPMVGDRKPVSFLATEFAERQAHFSPDGHWVAYASDAAGPRGHPEIYVRSFSMEPAGTVVKAGGQWQISSGGGFEPRWRGDGRELYYRSYPDGRVMAVEIAGGPSFRAGKPTSRPDGGGAWKRLLGWAVGFHRGRQALSRPGAPGRNGAVYGSAELDFAAQALPVRVGTWRVGMAAAGNAIKDVNFGGLAG